MTRSDELCHSPEPTAVGDEQRSGAETIQMQQGAAASTDVQGGDGVAGNLKPLFDEAATESTATSMARNSIRAFAEAIGLDETTIQRGLEYTTVKKLLGIDPHRGDPYVRSIRTVVDTSGLIPDNEKDHRELLHRVLEFIRQLEHDDSNRDVRKDDPGIPARAIGKQASRGALKNYELQTTAQHAAHGHDVTRELLEHGVLLPEYVPIVCPSFAASDLAMLKDERGKPVKVSVAHDGTRVRDDKHGEVDFNGCDEKAGHDAWSICDYLRDALLWPTESIFIDSEAFGTYFQGLDRPPQLYLHPRDGPPHSPPHRLYRQLNVDVVEEVEHKSPLVIKRNYRKVYQWAQRVSPVAILFLSTKWVNSANCRLELDDLIGLCNDEGTCEGRTVFVVWLDPSTEVLKEML